MPTYVYECKRCAHTFEVMQKMSDPPKKRCPKCQGALQKVFHPVGIVFKGSGFYKTDSSSSKRSSPSKEPAETKSETSSDTKSDTKSESKPDTKSESKAETKSPAKSETKSDGSNAPKK